MLSEVLTRLGRVRVTLAYAATLAAVAAVLLHLGPQTQQNVIRQASTNLRNLTDGKLGTLIGSAFVNESERVFLWLPGLVALLALGELLWHGRRLALAFVVGHVGATLVVAAGIAAALAAGLVPGAIADAADVGMSYGAVAVLGTFTAALPRRWRAAWAGAWLAVALGAVVLTRADFTADGHAVALLLGMLIGSRFGASQGWTMPRYALLAVASAFGYLVLAYGDLSADTTARLGLAGAIAGLGASVLGAGLGASVPGAGRGASAPGAAYTNSSADDSIQSDSHVSGGLSSNSPGISHS